MLELKKIVKVNMNQFKDLNTYENMNDLENEWTLKMDLLSYHHFVGLSALIYGIIFNLFFLFHLKVQILTFILMLFGFSFISEYQISLEDIENSLNNLNHF